MAKKQPEDPTPNASAAEAFLKNLTSTFDNDQQKQGLQELAGMFWEYYQSLQEKGFHRTKAFVLCRDWHGMWWTAKINHEMAHLHDPQDEQDEDPQVGG